MPDLEIQWRPWVQQGQAWAGKETVRNRCQETCFSLNPETGVGEIDHFGTEVIARSRRGILLELWHGYKPIHEFIPFLFSNSVMKGMLGQAHFRIYNCNLNVATSKGLNVISILPFSIVNSSSSSSKMLVFQTFFTSRDVSIVPLLVPPKLS